jgi:dihydroorotate dehydrogenase
LVFAGPSLVAEIKQGLAELLRADGFGSISDAIGTACERGAVRPIREVKRPA